MSTETRRLPKKIAPCPIVEAVVELRFTSTVPPEVIPGLLYENLKGQYPKTTNLPITNIPESIRNSDPALEFNPHYAFEGEKISIRVGPKSFAVIATGDYIGWTDFSKAISEAFEVFFNSGICEKAQRIGLRYINFYAGENAFNHLEVDLKFSGNSLIQQNNVVRNQQVVDRFSVTTQIVYPAIMNIGGKNFSGSSFDIDVVLEDESLSEKFMEVLEEAHTVEKKFFFDLLKEEYLKNLNTEY